MMKYLATILLLIILATPALANGLIDSDLDGVPDKDEIEIYHTNPYLADTDGDGYSDWLELTSGYSPHTKEPIKLEDSDQDGDGLSDRLELAFGTNLMLKDTDGDGFSDFEEVESGYDPLSPLPIKLPKRIEINLAKQEMSNFLGGVRLKTFPVSSGIRDSTPRGHFKIYSKADKAWSSFGLWMPHWMAITASGKYGIHELPYWPSGYVEGENHLGQPVSHGCIRLGHSAAQYMYDWTPVGTGVFIY